MVAVDVRFVDATSGHDKAVVGGDDLGRAAYGHHPRGFAGEDGQLRRVAVRARVAWYRCQVAFRL